MIARDFPPVAAGSAPRSERVHLNLAHASALALALRADGLEDIARDIERRLAHEGR